MFVNDNLSCSKISWAYIQKKNLIATEQNREDVKKARTEWFSWQKSVSVPKLVFLDESGIRTNITMNYGWSQKGERCFGCTPGAWKSYSILSAISSNKVIESVLIDGSLNKPTFKYFMEDLLLPQLDRNTIIIMDNLSVHKNSFDLYKFDGKSIKIKYLPPYSPDLNPIENMWSKVKSIIKKMNPRNFDAIWDAMNEALWCVTQSNLIGWFRGCGDTH